MKAKRKFVSVIQIKETFYVSLPKEFVNLLKIKKGEALMATFNDESIAYLRYPESTDPKWLKAKQILGSEGTDDEKWEKLKQL